ncbi:hypothetical protein [Methylobacterium dankookense]|uniref:Lipoprotein n=1 Tax=Methylobacterium dankookense TaxID=560405 RepID=A0A564G3F4_9HYPH|nr:hypothetical protein [Methylobacterium dankookense]GJD54907.1 hypothetical protein IFDJLNFL_0786 [Methylobacterium dankookense]VUF14500.1 hypothetical protein MTDSW087_04225 [Methylobacterium dankookense]
MLTSLRPAVALTALALTALPLAACVPTAAPHWLVAPADPAAAVRAPRYSAVTAGVARYDVVDPKDWRELNRAVTPKSGSGGMEGMEGMDHSRMPGMNMPGMGGKRDTGGR